MEHRHIQDKKKGKRIWKKKPEKCKTLTIFKKRLSFLIVSDVIETFTFLLRTD